MMGIAEAIAPNPVDITITPTSRGPNTPELSDGHPQFPQE